MDEETTRDWVRDDQSGTIMEINAGPPDDAEEAETLAMPELALILALIALAAGSFLILYWPLVAMMLQHIGIMNGPKS